MHKLIYILLILGLCACQQGNENTDSDHRDKTDSASESQPIKMVETSQDNSSDSLTGLYQQSVQNLLKSRPSYATVLGVDESLAGEDFQKKVRD